MYICYASPPVYSGVSFNLSHTCVYIQCIRKVFTALHFFSHFVTVSFQNVLNTFFFNILPTIHQNDNVKKDFCKCIKKKEEIASCLNLTIGAEGP